MNEIECNKCGTVKALDEFERRPDSKLGYRRTCKECRRAAKNATKARYYRRHADRLRRESKERRIRNVEHHRLADSAYRRRNRDKINERQRQYYYRNRSRLLAQKRANYAKDPQKYIARVKAHRRENLEQYRARDAKYYRLNREQILLRNRMRRAANPQKYRDYDALRRILQAEQRRASDRLYHLRNKERRNQQGRDYYAKTRSTSLDYGWGDGLPHDRQMYQIQQNDFGEASISDYVESLVDSLPQAEREWCRKFLDNGDRIPEHIMESIRSRVNA